jgi:hypothetical protein
MAITSRAGDVAREGLAARAGGRRQSRIDYSIGVSAFSRAAGEWKQLQRREYRSARGSGFLHSRKAEAEAGAPRMRAARRGDLFVVFAQTAQA